jgi:hypothetical protein
MTSVPVEVGLVTTSYAQITSGITEGTAVVTRTSTSRTSTSSSSSSTNRTVGIPGLDAGGPGGFPNSQSRPCVAGCTGARCRRPSLPSASARCSTPTRRPTCRPRGGLRRTPSTSTASAGSGAGGFARGSFAPNASGDPAGREFAGVGGGLTVEGTVTSVADGSITIRTSSGSTMTIGTSSSTTYPSQAAASATDVATGSKIVVTTSGFGRPNGGRGPRLKPVACRRPLPEPAAPRTPTLTATDVTIAGS